MRLALLDTDIIIYRSSILNEDAPLDWAIDEYKRIRDSWLDASGCDAYVTCMSKGVSFRKNWWEGYKASRELKPRPKHLTDLRDHVRNNDNPIEMQGIEADDVIGMLAAELDDFVIVTVDKDLDQIEGLHCNPDKQTSYFVDDDRAFMTWMMQILAGDATDCYPGVPGIGERKAFQMLDAACLADMPSIVRRCYESRDLSLQYMTQMIVCATIVKDIKWTEFSSRGTTDPSTHATFELFGLPMTG
jgi:hypothetical protein